MIPQGKKLPLTFFETFPEWMFSTKHEKKNNKNDRSPCSQIDIMDQSYPIYACTRANLARYSLVYFTFCDSWKHRVLQ